MDEKPIKKGAAKPAGAKKTAAAPSKQTTASSNAASVLKAVNDVQKAAISTAKNQGKARNKTVEEKTSDIASFAVKTVAAATVATAAASRGKTKKQKTAISFFAFVIVLLILASGGLYYFDIPPFDFDFTNSFGKYYNTNVPDSGEAVKIHFINVGQGDSILLQLPGGRNALIDGGENKNAVADRIISYITGLGISQLDFVMLTHSDSDHCGSLDNIINSDKILVKKVYMPYIKSGNAKDPLRDLQIQSVTTGVYSDFVQAVLNEKAEIEYSYEGMDISMSSSYSMTLYNPSAELYAKSMSSAANKNNVSPIIILTYGGKKVVLTGDADDLAEKNFLKNVQNINADVDVLKVAHHGGRESTSQEFLNSVLPEYAVISVGDNSYGHPTPETLSRLKDVKSKVFRTDLDGDIVLTVSGGKISFKTNSEEFTAVIHFSPRFSFFRKAA